MNFKKLTLNAAIILGLLSSNQILPMWKAIEGNFTEAKDWAFGTEEEQYSEEWEKERPARESLERIKKCEAEEINSDPQDILEVCCNPKIAEEYKNTIQKVKDRRKKNNNDIYEIAKANNHSCNGCNSLVAPRTMNCPICLKAFFCNQNCYDLTRHKESCSIAITEEKEMRARQCLARAKTCFEKTIDPDPNDILDACNNIIVKAENQNSIDNIISLRLSKNENMRKKAFENNPKCSYCSFSPLKYSSCLHCIFCLKAFYCDSKCKENHLANGHKEECCENISVEKKEKRIAESVDKIKEANAKNEQSDSEDYFYAHDDTDSKNNKAWNIAKEKRISCNTEKIQQEFQKNPICSICHEKIDSYESFCSSCLKCFYCKDCSKNTGKHSRKDCLKTILKDKEEKSIADGVNWIKEANAKNQVPDPEDFFYARKDTNFNNSEAKIIAMNKISLHESYQKIMSQAFQKNPICSLCNENISKDQDHNFCAFCIIATYCAKCTNLTERHNIKDCLRNILQGKKEKRTTEFAAEFINEFNKNKNPEKTKIIEYFDILLNNAFFFRSNPAIKKSIEESNPIFKAHSENTKLLKNCSGCKKELTKPENTCCCNLCGKTIYCSDECALKHWDEHKKDCVKELSDGKKYLTKIEEFVKNPTKKNLFDFRKFYLAPENSIYDTHQSLHYSSQCNSSYCYTPTEEKTYQQQNCPSCNTELKTKKKEDLLACPICQKILYCNMDCCHHHWNAHKEDCLKTISAEENIQKPEQPKEKVKVKENKNTNVPYVAEKDSFDFSKHIKLGHYAKVDNVDYIQLNTVDQFSDNLVSEVNEKYNAVLKETETEKNEAQKKILLKKLSDFAPNATCGRQAIRNAFLIDEFLQNNNNEKGSLENINNELLAKAYLKEILTRKNESPTSWLSSKVIEQEIEERFVTGTDKRVTFIDNLMELKTGSRSELKPLFKNKSYYHIFIVYTGGHWYVIAIDKRNEKTRCLIMDSHPLHNHTSDKDNFFDGNKFLCEQMLGIESEVKPKSEAPKEDSNTMKEAKSNQDNPDIKEILSDDQIYTEERNILRKHTKGHEKVDNIDFFWLNSIDHSDQNITKDVANKHEEMNYYSLVNDARNKESKIVGFLPEGTSGAHAIKNAFYIHDFLDENNEKRILENYIGEYNEKLLEDIGNPEIAKKNLKDLIDKGKRTSFLEERVIEGRVAEKDLANKITVLDSVLEIETTKRKRFIEIIKNFSKKDNFSHVFIINTADIFHFTRLNKRTGQSESILNKLARDFQKKERYKVDENSLKEFANKLRDVNEWYVLAIEKKAEKITCFIIDTEHENEERSQFKKQSNNIFLCKFILDQNQDLIEALKKKIEDEAMETFYEAVEKGLLKPSANDLQFLINLDKKEMSKEMEESIYNSSPKDVKELIDHCISVRKEKEKLPTVNANELPNVFILNGPCGTGKSEITKVIAKKSGRELCFICCGLLGTKYQHSTADNLKLEIYPLLEQCKNGASYLVVFDEADALTKKNGTEDRNLDDSAAAVSGILDLCKQYDIVFACTTNHATELTSKLKSRAKCKIIEVGPPTKIARKWIIKYLLADQVKKFKRGRRINLDTRAVNLDTLAKDADKFSIRYLESLIEDTCENMHEKILRDNDGEIKEEVLADKDFKEPMEKTKKNMKKYEDLPISYKKKMLTLAFDKLFVPLAVAGAKEFLRPIPGILLSKAVTCFEYYNENRILENERRSENSKHFLNPWRYLNSYHINAKQKMLKDQYRAKISGFDVSRAKGLGRDLWDGTKEVVVFGLQILSAYNGIIINLGSGDKTPNEPNKQNPNGLPGPTGSTGPNRLPGPTGSNGKN